MAARKKAAQFETALADLELLVQSLETGDLSLEESLKAFEEGIKLTRECQKALTDAEQKVALLLGESEGEAIEGEFDAAAAPR